MGRYDEQQSGNSLNTLFIWGFLIIILAAAGYYFFTQQSAPQDSAHIQKLELPIPVEIAKRPATVPGKEETLVAEPHQDPDLIDQTRQQLFSELSSIDGQDAQVRKFFQFYSADLLPMAQADELLKKMTRIFNDFAQGQRQYKHMLDFTLSSPFMAQKSGNQWIIAQQNYARYDALINGLLVIDDALWLHAYTFFKPHLQKNYAEFGYPEHYTLEDMLQKAAAEIIATPQVQGNHALVKHGVLYKFADAELESLSPVQKQVIRMGPENSQKLKQKLRQVMQLLAAQVKE